jgi:CBS domain-containing protein
MLVRDVMTSKIVTIGPEHTLREAAKTMNEHKVGSAVVIDPESSGVGIITERDVLRAVANDQDMDRATARDHLTSDLVYAAPDWTLEQATDAMRRGGFRHLVVLEGSDVLGIISVRDVVAAWTPSHV